MTTTIVTESRFESAHFLPHAPAEHKCRRLHGHSYRCEIHVTGPVDPHSGWVCDFSDMRAAFAPIKEELDHHTLNDIAGLENPTSERLAAWIWTRLSTRLPGLRQLVIHETANSRCIYSGPDGTQGPHAASETDSHEKQDGSP